MKRLFLLAVAVILVVSGCSIKDRPSAAKAQAPAQQAVQAAANTTPSPEAAGPAATTAAANRLTEAAAKSESANSESAKPDAAKTGAKQPETVTVTSEAVSEPKADAAAGAAVPAQPTSPAPVSASVAEKTALQIGITGDKKRGVILQELSVPFQKGTTVLDVLKQVTKDNKIQMEYKGKGTYAYVQGIDNLYEFDGGPKSGWVYKVNGRAPGEGAGSYKAAAGDKIEWLYTLNLGEDVGAIMK